ncbi:MAG TPA: tetratricopeptide repeat protein [Gammaproteobacteria bacterium]|nr:tetratricopeptide repeat protein [Gammaproteobacteria bacterium]
MTDGYISDDEQWEKFKAWWKANGTFIIVGLAIGLAIIGGWRWWQHYRAQREYNASALYAQFEQALNKPAASNDKNKSGEAEAIGKNLITNYDDTPYAAQAALGLAATEVVANRADQAIQHLQWVVQHSDDGSLKLLARLRLARVQIANKQAKDALKTLSVKDAGGFASLYDEVRGDAYRALGEIAKAHQAYQAALAAQADGTGSDALLKLKLQHTASAKPATAGKS